MRAIWLIQAVVASFVMSTAAFAQVPGTKPGAFCSEQKGLGWHFYCEDPPQDEAPPPAKAETQEVPPPVPSDPNDQVALIRQNLDRAKNAAVLDPTNLDKVANYIRMQRTALDMASTFSQAWGAVLLRDPELDYTLEHPVSSAGKQVWLEQRRRAELQAVADLRDRYGVYFIYSHDCPYCQAYAPILKSWAMRNGVSITAVTIDGVALPEFPNSLVDRGQVAALGLAGKPIPMTILFDAQKQQVIPIGFGLLSEQDLTEHVFVQTQVELGNDY
ncbi:conjugal transfer protein TraF [Nitrospirillum amazonense]|uniref:conjugal transfer protein TraF n=1 Tax=Nitrospirillum amazonense TaxID=28077 RepID=UPI00241252C9|nr:conjugal transfer protein TraF [Nitrospirillum amazonense]MDG3444546.1 conjugal transfer protein TraF [Nitrospirillum amazonense]